MKCAVIIAEYNPFHNGHQWQIQKLRELGYTHIAAIMSGDFVQRGAPAVFPKSNRTKMALQGGVDLIIELPLPYACATAQRFAFGAVRLADAMGCGDVLCFGSECGHLEPLQQAVSVLELPQLKDQLQHFLAQGMSFAKARTLAVSALSSPEIAALLEEPNNTLGIEYLLQLRQLHSDLIPLTLPRNSVSHHQEGSQEGFASASYIRQLLLQKQQNQAVSLVPAINSSLLSQSPVVMDPRIVLSRLRSLEKEQLSHLPDCSEGLENRIYQAIRDSVCIEELWEKTKTKRYSLARIRRLTMAAFLQMDDELHRQSPPYLRVLGFNSKGQELLAKMRKTSTLPVSGSLADLAATSDLSKRFAQTESRSVDLYNLFESELKPCGQDFRFSPIRL